MSDHNGSKIESDPQHEDPEWAEEEVVNEGEKEGEKEEGGDSKSQELNSPSITTPPSLNGHENKSDLLKEDKEDGEGEGDVFDVIDEEDVKVDEDVDSDDDPKDGEDGDLDSEDEDDGQKVVTNFIVDVSSGEEADDDETFNGDAYLKEEKEKEDPKKENVKEM